MSVEDLFEFVFSPSEFQHPQSTGRLLALAMYGPLDEQLKLRSGLKVGNHGRPLICIIAATSSASKASA
jgi:hypothetical protein